MIILNQLKSILDELLRVWRGQYQPTQLYLQASFFSPAETSFFLICAGDGVGFARASCQGLETGKSNLERWTLCFSSYNELELAKDVYWRFVTFTLFEGNICFISMVSVLNKISEYLYFIYLFRPLLLLFLKIRRKASVCP